MKVSAVFCESIEQTTEGKVNLSGLFHAIRPNSLPEKTKFSILLNIEDFDARIYERFTTKVFSPDESVLATRGGKIDNDTNVFVKGTDILAPHMFVFIFNDIEISEEGIYKVTVEVDEQKIYESYFAVEKVQDNVDI